jgi:hypothetical protein
LTQALDVIVGYVTTIFAQMGRNAVGSGVGSHTGGAYGIGMQTAAGVPNGRDMVDVHAEMQTFHGIRSFVANSIIPLRRIMRWRANRSIRWRRVVR